MKKSEFYLPGSEEPCGVPKQKYAPSGEVLNTGTANSNACKYQPGDE